MQDMERLVLRFPRWQRDDVLGALGELLASESIEIVSGPEAEPAYNQALVDVVLHPETNKEEYVIKLATFKNVAEKLGMDPGTGTRTHNVLGRHFGFGMYSNRSNPLPYVKATDIPGLVDD